MDTLWLTLGVHGTAGSSCVALVWDPCKSAPTSATRKHCMGAQVLAGGVWLQGCALGTWSGSVLRCVDMDWAALKHAGKGGSREQLQGRGGQGCSLLSRAQSDAIGMCDTCVCLSPDICAGSGARSPGSPHNTKSRLGKLTLLLAMGEP